MGTENSDYFLKTFLKAFDNGWTREVVYRKSGTGCDIYYLKGKDKIRSSKELLRYLKKNNESELSEENFSWKRHPLGLGEPMEIVRDVIMFGPSTSDVAKGSPKKSKKKLIGKGKLPESKENNDECSADDEKEAIIPGIKPSFDVTKGILKTTKKKVVFTSTLVNDYSSSSEDETGAEEPIDATKGQLKASKKKSNAKGMSTATQSREDESSADEEKPLSLPEIEKIFDVAPSPVKGTSKGKKKSSPVKVKVNSTSTDSQSQEESCSTDDTTCPDIDMYPIEDELTKSPKKKSPQSKGKPDLKEYQEELESIDGKERECPDITQNGVLPDSTSCIDKEIVEPASPSKSGRKRHLEPTPAFAKIQKEKVSCKKTDLEEFGSHLVTKKLRSSVAPLPLSVAEDVIEKEKKSPVKRSVVPLPLSVPEDVEKEKKSPVKRSVAPLPVSVPEDVIEKEKKSPVKRSVAPLPLSVPEDVVEKEKKSPVKLSSKVSSKSEIIKKGQVVANDLKIYMKPLELGWVREVVHRKHKSQPRGCDVYYHTPDKKRKLRSANEVSKYNLGKELTEENFTFVKASILPKGMEVVRRAK